MLSYIYVEVKAIHIICCNWFINPIFLCEVYLETSVSICLFSSSEEPRDCYIGTVTVAWRVLYSTKCNELNCLSILQVWGNILYWCIIVIFHKRIWILLVNNTLELLTQSCKIILRNGVAELCNKLQNPFCNL